MTIAEIARLEALLETATSGEWNPEDVYSGEYTLRVEDCHLIAAMKNALPELLKAARSEAVATAALRELVRLKDLHDHIEGIAFETMDEYRAAVVEYNAKKPRAWGAAREAIESSPSTPKEVSRG